MDGAARRDPAAQWRASGPILTGVVAGWGVCGRIIQDAYLQKVIVVASEGFLGVVKGVRATVDKRNRKLIDHDRWLTNVKKAQEANDKAGGAKIAEVTKAESQFDVARQEYESINTRIKEEMPVLMSMRPAFVDPILQTLVVFGVRQVPAPQRAPALARC
jgi:hypothetical protein